MEKSIEAVTKWAAEHQTSVPVARAIFEIATNEEHAEEIWLGDMLSNEQERVVTARAWELADVGDDVLTWGVTTLTRPAKVVTVKHGDHPTDINCHGVEQGADGRWRPVWIDNDGCPDAIDFGPDAAEPYPTFATEAEARAAVQPIADKYQASN